MEALKLAPNSDFQRWLKMRIDMWSKKQLYWKQDGSDLMEEAEQYYLELKTTRSWQPKSKGNEIYALECTLSDDSEKSEESNKDQLSEKENSMLMALATQMKMMKQKKKNQPKNDKYKWKLIPPKDEEQNTKKNSRWTKEDILLVHTSPYVDQAFTTRVQEASSRKQNKGLKGNPEQGHKEGIHRSKSSALGNDYKFRERGG
jgi:hypothetical protein